MMFFAEQYYDKLASRSMKIKEKFHLDFCLFFVKI